MIVDAEFVKDPRGGRCSFSCRRTGGRFPGRGLEDKEREQGEKSWIPGGCLKLGGRGVETSWKVKINKSAG